MMNNQEILHTFEWYYLYSKLKYLVLILKIYKIREGCEGLLAYLEGKDYS